MNKLIILDRDGVINYDSDQYIKSLDEFIFIPESIKAIGLLTELGYKIGVATNQSGIFRKYYSLNTLHQMHHRLLSAVQEVGGQIDKISFCPHGPNDRCSCRKPKTGMLKEISTALNADKNQTIMIGDSITDLQAAENFGIKGVLVKTGKGERSLSRLKQDPGLLKNPISIFDNLYAFAIQLNS